MQIDIEKGESEWGGGTATNMLDTKASSKTNTSFRCH